MLVHMPFFLVDRDARMKDRPKGKLFVCALQTCWFRELKTGHQEQRTIHCCESDHSSGTCHLAGHSKTTFT